MKIMLVALINIINNDDDDDDVVAEMERRREIHTLLLPCVE